MLSISDLILEQHANLLRKAAILVYPAGEGTEPWLLFLLTHEVKSGAGFVLSKRLQFVRVGAGDHAGAERIAQDTMFLAFNSLAHLLSGGPLAMEMASRLVAAKMECAAGESFSGWIILFRLIPVLSRRRNGTR